LLVVEPLVGETLIPGRVARLEVEPRSISGGTLLFDGVCRKELSLAGVRRRDHRPHGFSCVDGRWPTCTDDDVSPCPRSAETIGGWTCSIRSPRAHLIGD